MYKKIWAGFGAEGSVFAGCFAEMCVLNVVFCVVERGEMRGEAGQKTVTKTGSKLRHHFQIYFAPSDKSGIT